MKKRSFAALAALLLTCTAAPAQTFPTRPIHIIVPIGPGGGYDLTGRLLAEGMQADLGQPVVVDNRPGAGTVIGTNYVAKSAPDGYTLLVGGTGSIAHVAGLVKELPFNVGNDLVPLALTTTNSYTLTARSDFGPKDLGELLAYARANPGKLTIGTPGPGTGQAVAMSLFKTMAGLDLVEVQYKNAPPIYVDMMAGRIDLFFDATGTAQAFVRSGKVRGIMTSGSKRDFILPDLPTASESGLKEMVLESWTGLFAPAQTPRPIVLRLRESVQKAAATPRFQEQMKSHGYSMFSPTDVEAFIKVELQRWPALLAKSGIKPQ